jgi:hypothetical protein
MVTEDIEKADLFMEGLFNYFRVSTAIIRTNTVHTLIEEVLKKYQAKLEEKKTKVHKKYEKDLLEIIIPDEQLRYILNAIVYYAVVSIPPNENLGVLTKSFVLRKGEGEDSDFLDKYGQYVEIRVFFTDYKKPAEHGGPGFETPFLRKDEEIDPILQLVKKMVLRNQGMMRVEINEKEAKVMISLEFPVERRKVIHDLNIKK